MRAWLLPFLWLGTIIVVGDADLVPVRGSDGPWFALRKLLHVGAYAILSILYCRALAQEGRRIERHLGMIAFTLTVVSGGFDEWQQSFVVGRDSRVADVGFDTIGAALGLAVMSVVRRA